MSASVAQLEAEIARLRGENARLRAEMAKLRAQLEGAVRSGKRQAAPFRKSEGPCPNPKKPGRKSGRRHGPHAHRTAPERIDEHIDVPLPDCCPHCGSAEVSETEVATQYQTEIPRQPIHREFNIHVGCCQECGRRVQGRHALQTSDALGAAASQLGSEAHAALVVLNKDMGLSHGKCAHVLGTILGIPIARATSARSILRSAQLGASAHEQIREEVRSSRIVVPDETGWRVGGRNAWLHGFATTTATSYAIGGRGGEIAEELLGIDWSGTLIHDGWSPYDRFTAAEHQQCIGHLQRRCEHLMETTKGVALALPRQVLELIDQAFALRRAWRGHRFSGEALAEKGFDLSCELEDLASGYFRSDANRRLANHIAGHSMQWFWFLMRPGIDATNYRAEQAMRPAAVNRKVWGGNRTHAGAKAQAILMSVSRTLWQKGIDVMDWLSRLRRSPSTLLLPDG